TCASSIRSRAASVRPARTARSGSAGGTFRGRTTFRQYVGMTKQITGQPIPAFSQDGTAFVAERGRRPTREGANRMRVRMLGVLLAILLVASGVALAQEATPEPDVALALDETYRADDIVFTVDYPSGWVTRPSFPN